MEVITIKNVSFPLEDELHMELKIQATREGSTIKDYVIELIKQDLEKKKEQAHAPHLQ